jgi:hypothetical protein
MAQQLSRWIAPVVALALALTAGAATRNNDDSCDIGVVPAATLLLPYFEVDLDDPNGEQTIFTITNVTNLDRIARVTLWTDYAFPVITFNIQLTGYGMQAISLYDVLARGVIGPQTSVARGRYSDPNPASACNSFPRTLLPEQVEHIQRAFTEGFVPAHGTEAACDVGNPHDNAIGYATIDLVTNCAMNNPLAEQYWTEDIAFDNVLIGDFQQIHSANDFAQGSPMVHIRAIPEGGTPVERMAYHAVHGSNFRRTFYTRYQPWYDPLLDSRQPLPSVFAARWIEGGASGYRTSLKIWREGRTGAGATCRALEDNVATFAEVARFDEAENGVGFAAYTYFIRPDMPRGPYTTPMPVTVKMPLGYPSLFPQLTNGAVGGWIYLNLDNDDSGFTYQWASQNWVVVSMEAEGRYSADVDAAVLGNGCSPQTPTSMGMTRKGVIGPRP